MRYLSSMLVDNLKKDQMRVNRLERGFTLIELLISTAISLIVVSGLVSVFLQGVQAANNFLTHQSAMDVRATIIETLMDPTAIQNTVDKAQADFACILSGTECADEFKLVQIVTRDPNVLLERVYDPKLAENHRYLGFTRSGTQCFSSKETGDKACRFQARVSWKGLCATPCVDPQIEWQIKFSDGDKEAEKYNVGNWDFSFRTKFGAPPLPLKGMDSGLATTCLITGLKEVMCWGSTIDGNLGYGPRHNTSAVPDYVLNADGTRLTDVEQMVNANGTACAIRSDKRLYCWGENQYGQLGHGGSTGGFVTVPGWTDPGAACETRVTTPVRNQAQTGYLEDVSEVIGGENNMCARSGNDYYCWGLEDSTLIPLHEDDDPPLGPLVYRSPHPYYNAPRLIRSVPFGKLEPPNPSWLYEMSYDAVVPTNIVSMMASYGRACAIIDPVLRELICWGRPAGYLAELDSEYDKFRWIHANHKMPAVGTGSRSITSTSGPNMTGVLALSGRTEEHTCALIQDSVSGKRRVACWGHNRGGLGIGLPEIPTQASERFPPSWVLGPTSAPLDDVTNFSSAWHHSCAVVDSGDVYCWGKNTEGQIGDGTLSYAGVAKRVIGLPGPAEYTSAGDKFSCAFMRDKSIYCWGANDGGQLGRGTRTPRELAPGKVQVPTP